MERYIDINIDMDIDKDVDIDIVIDIDGWREGGRKRFVYGKH